MFPKTLHSIRGNATIRVWTQAQMVALGASWREIEPPAEQVAAPDAVPEPEVRKELTIIRKRGRPRTKG